MKTYVKLGVALVLLAVLVYLLLVFDIPRAKAPDIAGDVTFTRSSSTLELIRVAEPLASSTVSSPLFVSGEARGSWYFEGSFPLEVIGENGSKLGEGIAQAKGDWMTSDFVPFTATVSFAPKGNKAGIVRFMKDNPSGEARFSAHVDIPVTFSGVVPTVAKACKPGGCSGEVCSDEDVASACIYKAEFACYKTATCARRANGACGWTETSGLASCISKARANGGESVQ